MSQPEPSRSGRGVLAGVAAGIVGIGCCVGPAVAALVGVTSAAVAIDVANSLYAEWGWAFKIAGVTAGAAAIGLVFRSRRRCQSRTVRPWRYALVVAVTGILTYGALYGLTTWLGEIAESSQAATEVRASP